MSYKVDLFSFMISSLAQYEEQVLWESEPPVCALQLFFSDLLGPSLMQTIST